MNFKQLNEALHSLDGKPVSVTLTTDGGASVHLEGEFGLSGFAGSPFMVFEVGGSIVTVPASSFAGGSRIDGNTVEFKAGGNIYEVVAN